MKIEIEFDETDLKTYVVKQIAASVAKKFMADAGTWWVEDEVKSAIQSAVTVHMKDVIQEMLGDYEARKVAAQPAIEKALTNRVARAIKKMENS